MLSLVLVLVVLTWVPLALVARARVTPSAEPRIHLFQDMDNQPKFKAQSRTSLFVDRRAMRTPVEGTVARGRLGEDDHYHRGYEVGGTDGEGQPQVTYFDGMPQQVRVDEALLLRGQDMYDVYCFTCHGMTGEGNGPTHQRAARLMANPSLSLGTSWTAPSNLVIADDNGQLTYGPELYPDGKLFNVITNGIRNMPAYGDQIAVKDRWAIVAYLRALQVSQHDASASNP